MRNVGVFNRKSNNFLNFNAKQSLYYAVCNCLRGANTLVRLERDAFVGSVLVAAKFFAVDHQPRGNKIPRVLLRRQHFKRLSIIALEGDQIARLRAFWR